MGNSVLTQIFKAVSAGTKVPTPHVKKSEEISELFDTLEKAKKHEQAVQYFKRH